MRISAPPTISLNNFGLSRLAPYRASVLCCVGPKRKPRFPLGTEAYIQPRIIKGTSRSAERKQIGSDRLRMVLHLSEDPGQGADQFRSGREVPVVSSGLSRVLPEALRGIELR